MMSKRVNRKKRTEETALEEYSDYSNDVVGLLAFNLGLACLSLPKNNRLFAVISLIIVFTTLFRKGRHYKKYLKKLGFITVLRQNPVYFLGLLWLFFIAAGKIKS